MLIDLKKLKRRQYQAKRRQSQTKEPNASAPKKRPRKVSLIIRDGVIDGISKFPCWLIYLLEIKRQFFLLH